MSGIYALVCWWHRFFGLSIKSAVYAGAEYRSISHAQRAFLTNFSQKFDDSADAPHSKTYNPTRRAVFTRFFVKKSPMNMPARRVKSAAVLGGMFRHLRHFLNRKNRAVDLSRDRFRRGLVHEPFEDTLILRAHDQ